MSTIAVFGVIAGGGAYAAAKIESEDIAKNAVLSKHLKAGNVKGSDLAAGAVGTGHVADGSLGTADLGAGSVGASQIIDDAVMRADLAENSVDSTSVVADSLTGSDIDEGTLELPDPPPSAVEVRRMSLVEGDVSEPVIFERDDWRFTVSCADDPTSGFPQGSVTLRYLHADDGTRAHAIGVDGGTWNLSGAPGSGSRAILLQSNAKVVTGPFFASDDLDGIRGLLSLRVPSRDGGYSGPTGCQFEIVVLG